MKAIDELRNHMKFMCDHGLMRMEMDTVNTHLDEIERELEEEYAPLPKDADGVPIRVGDVMENMREDLESRLHRRFKVYGIHYRDYEQVCTLTEEGYPTILYRANECRHYHAPTVESTLQKLLEQAVGYSDAHTTVALDAISEYATKFRLSDDVEAE